MFTRHSDQKEGRGRGGRERAAGSCFWSRGGRSDFPRPHGDDQSEIVEEGLAVDAGIEKSDLPAEEAALPRGAEQIEQRAVFRRHVRPEWLERRHMHVAPALEAAAREHAEPADAVAQPCIAADDVFVMHA